jgi:hypothetical protein
LKATETVSAIVFTQHKCITNFVGKHCYWERNLPSRASSKQCVGSQCDVNMVTLWPLFWRPTAASMTRRSAPPIPRSGWKKTTCWDVEDAMIPLDPFRIPLFYDVAVFSLR